MAATKPQRPATPTTPTTPAAPRRAWGWAAVKLLVGTACYLAAALMVFLVMEHALSRAVAVATVLVGAVLTPLAVTQLLVPALRRVDPDASFADTLPGVAGLLSIVTLVALPLAARGPVSAALTAVATRYASAGPVPVRVARALGDALATTPPPDAGARDAGVLDAGARDAAAPAVDAPRDVAADTLADTQADTLADTPDAADDAPADAADEALADALADAAPAPAAPGVLAEVRPCEFVWAIQCADLEGEAAAEVIAQCSEMVRVLHVADDGVRTRLSFEPVAPAGLVARVGRPAVADLDGDGRRDLVLCAHYTTPRGGGRGGVTYTSQNLGDGRWGPLVAVDHADGCGAAAVADVTGDGVAELLVAHTGNPWQPGADRGDIAWFARQGRGWTRRGRHPVGVFPDRVFVEDVNGDRIPDALVGHGWNSDDVTVVLPGSRGGLRPMDATLRAPATPPRDRAACPFDRDDALDEAALVDNARVRVHASALVGPTRTALTEPELVLPPRPDAGGAAGTDAAADAAGAGGDDPEAEP